MPAAGPLRRTFVGPRRPRAPLRTAPRAERIPRGAHTASANSPRPDGNSGRARPPRAPRRCRAGNSTGRSATTQNSGTTAMAPGNPRGALTTALRPQSPSRPHRSAGRDREGPATGSCPHRLHRSSRGLGRRRLQHEDAWGDSHDVVDIASANVRTRSSIPARPPNPTSATTGRPGERRSLDPCRQRHPALSERRGEPVARNPRHRRASRHSDEGPPGSLRPTPP